MNSECDGCTESGDEGQCVCGARDHRGECHFGWHNPETCPDAAAQPEPEPGLRTSQLAALRTDLMEMAVGSRDPGFRKGIEAALNQLDAVLEGPAAKPPRSAFRVNEGIPSERG